MAIELDKYITSLAGEASPILKRFAKNFSISFVGSLFLMVLSLGRTILLTRSLAIDDYGRVLIVINLVSFLINFLSVRVEDVIFRFYPEFKEANDLGGLRGLFFICIILSALVGFIVSTGLFILAPWIAGYIYDDPTLTLSFRIYSFTAFLWASVGMSTAILRLQDRFAAVVVPRTLGAAVVLIALMAYFYNSSSYSLEYIVAIFCLEICIESLFPLIQALRVISPYLFMRDQPILQSLNKHRHKLVLTIFNTNLYGYLVKLVGSPGDAFLLGVFSTPAQVAIFSIAQQIVRIAVVLQNNFQTAITPEIVSLWAKGKVKQLYNFLTRFLKVSSILGAIGLLLIFITARPVILLISGSEYLEAVPVLLILSLKVYLSFATLPFYSITLSMDSLNRRNIALFVQLLMTGFAIVITLSAFKIALIQLLGTLLISVLCDLPVAIKLRQLSKNLLLTKV